MSWRGMSTDCGQAVAGQPPEKGRFQGAPSAGPDGVHAAPSCPLLSQKPRLRATPTLSRPDRWPPGASAGGAPAGSCLTPHGALRGLIRALGVWGSLCVVLLGCPFAGRDQVSLLRPRGRLLLLFPLGGSSTYLVLMVTAAPASP